MTLVKPLINYGLLFRLKTAGDSVSLLNGFSDYLVNRQQRVILPGVTSNSKPVNADERHGSVLGPILFLLYTNDIVDTIHSSIWRFADDTSLFVHNYR